MKTFKGRKLYKVLRAGKSCHGGDFTWSLPENGKPGKWHTVAGELALCSNGFHLTSDPAQWYGVESDYEVYEVEAQGVHGIWDDTDKVVAKKVRLIRRLEKDDLTKCRIFYDGVHEVKTDKRVWCFGSSQVTAYGSSKVTACDSSKVTAYGSSQVTAYGSSKVTACDSSKVTACDSSKVTACDSSQVTACDSSKVTACDSSQVTACDSSQVTAYGSSKVTACDSSQVTAYGSSKVTACDSSQVNGAGKCVIMSFNSWDSPTVNLTENAVYVDQRSK